MLTPQFVLPIASELIIDLFAGGGGASTGIEQAISRHVDIAINHDPEAVSLHEANHPQTRHFVSDVFEVDPLVVTDGQPVGMLWASPDCKHFSKAKGGKPVSKKIRSLAWVVIKWAKLVRPRMIFLENVEEFQTWGPLGADDRPCPLRKGQTFAIWKRELEKLGYVIEHKELRACDYGAPTIRKRLFLVARCDGMPIIWPAQTHGAPDSLPVKQKKLKPWRTAADCIDWSIPAPSIFERKKPLAEATNRRIAKGIVRYVIEAKQPFIVPLTHQGGDRTESIAEPMKTVTGANRGEKALIVPTLSPFLTEHANASTQRNFGADEPLRTQCAQVKGGHFALVSAFLAKHYTGVVGSDLNDSMGTVTSVDHHSLVTAHVQRDMGKSIGHAADSPLGTVTAGGGGKSALVMAHLTKFNTGSTGFAADTPMHTITAGGEQARPGTAITQGIVTSNLIKLRGDNVGSATDTPLHTISAQGMHHAEVRSFLVKYYGTDQDPALLEPLHTVTTKDRFGLVMIKGEPYAIVDIGLRMLAPRELYRAQGFPESYRIDAGADGRPLTKTAQVRMCGNSVCPPLANAIVAANYKEIAFQRKAA